MRHSQQELESPGKGEVILAGSEETLVAFESGLGIFWGFPGGLDGKESACHVGDLGSIPELRRFPGEGNATHSSILAWRIPWTEEPGGNTVHGVAASQTRLSD